MKNFNLYIKIILFLLIIINVMLLIYLLYLIDENQEISQYLLDKYFEYSDYTDVAKKKNISHKYMKYYEYNMFINENFMYKYMNSNFDIKGNHSKIVELSNVVRSVNYKREIEIINICIEAINLINSNNK